MEIPVNLFYWLMSLVPIALLMLLMGRLFWGAAKAALVTLGVTLLVSIFVFKASFFVVFFELLKAAWSSLSIILVIMTAISLYEVSRSANGFLVLSKLAKQIAPNELMRILLIGVVFASFLQGVSGFGVPVLITAPLLLRMGVSPYWATLIPLLGHSWAGTYGTLALAWTAMLQQLGLEESALLSSAALYASFFLLVLLAAAIFFIAFSYGKWEAVKKTWPALLLIIVLQGGGQMLLAGPFPELAVFLPSAFTLLGFIFLSKSTLYNKEWKIESSKIMKSAEVMQTVIEKEEKEEKEKREKTTTEIAPFQSLFPYLLISLFALPALLIPALNQGLSRISFGPSFPESVTGFQFMNPEVAEYAPLAPFKHASFFLFLAALLSFLYYKKKNLLPKEMKAGVIAKQAFVRGLPPSIAVLSLMGIAKIMSGTGQTVVLAQGIAATMKGSYPLVAPLVGMIGSFLTGGNMSSNILFGDFQFFTAELIGANSAAVIGAQTAGGAVGMMIAPSVMVLGTASTGLLGKEGRLILKIAPFVLTVTLLMGVLLFFFS